MDSPGPAAAAQAPSDGFTEGSPSRGRGVDWPHAPAPRAISPLFTEGDPARGRVEFPLFHSPPVSPSPHRRVFDWSELSDSDSDDLEDPDSPRFFDSPERFYSRRFQSEYMIIPPMKRARYGSLSPSSAEDAAATSASSKARTATQRAPSASPPRHVVVPARARGRGGVAVVAVPGGNEPEPEAPFVLHPSQGPAAGQTNRDFIISRILDLNQEYENLAVECRNFKRQTHCADQSRIANAWKMLSDRLKICQVVRIEIKNAGGTVGEIPYELLFGQGS